MFDENFLKQFNAGKLKSWDKNYIDYIFLCNKIVSIIDKFTNDNQNIPIEDKVEEKKEDKDYEEDIFDGQNQIELSNTELRALSNDLINEDKEKLNIIGNIAQLDNNTENSNKTAIDSKKLKIFKKPTKEFISLLDREIKKIHAFYISKETELFEGVTTQIELFNNLRNKEKNNEKKIKIISDIKYLSKLGQSLINYVYLNIKALKNLLNIYDNQIIFISYKYMKKHLSKNNGDLIYILNFKILDECLLAINDLFYLVKDNLDKEKAFKNNKQLSELFSNDNEEILYYIQNIELIHEKIFEELMNLEKYLNMGLGLPSSSYHSIFKNTSFIGDSIYPPSDRGKKKSKKKTSFENKYTSLIKEKKIESENLNLDENNIKEDNIDAINKDEDKNITSKQSNEKEKNENKNECIIENIEKIELYDDNDNDKLITNDSFKSSDIFKKSDVYSYSTLKVLSMKNIINLNILLSLVFLYSFSLSFIIPNIIIFLKKNDNNNINPKDKNLFLYGAILTIIYLGNLFSKIAFTHFFDKSFKKLLVFSSIFILSYYIMLIASVELKIIYLLLIGRFFLGFSILRHLSKIYVNQYVPISNQIKANQKQRFYYNFGFSIGFLLNAIFAIKWEITFLGVNIEIYTIINYVFTLYGLTMLLLILFLFKEPTKYSLLTQTLLDFNIRHRLSKAFLVENEERKKTEQLDKNYIEVNDSSNISQENVLDIFVNEHMDNSYFTKIKIILIILLISSEYISENLFLFIPRLMAYNINKENYDNKYLIIITSVILFVCFIISYLFQKLNLMVGRFKNQKIRKIIIIIFILIILNGSFYFIVFKKKIINELISYVIFPGVGTFLIILINEVYHVIIINLFIQLFPTENIKFCCLNIATAINIITKITKLVPASIIIIYFKFYDNNFKSFLLYENLEICFCNYILFGIQIINFIICLLLVIFNHSSLKSSYKNRLLSQKITLKKLTI